MARRRLVSQADLAELAGVSRMAISKASRARLKAAMVGDRIHLDHPDVQAYLSRKRAQRQRQLAKTLPALDPPDAAAQPGKAEAADGDDIPKEDVELLRRMAEKHGGKRGFRDWLDALKRTEDIRKLRLDNDETEGALIRRDFVKQYLFGAVDAMTRRLLNDLPTTAVARIYAAARAGEPIEDAERVLVGLLSDTLKPFATTMKQRLEVAGK